MNGINEVIAAENPDIVLVHGDTTTSFAAGLATFYQQKCSDMSKLDLEHGINIRRFQKR